MKKKCGLVLFFFYVFFSVSYSQTPIPKTFKCLYVNPSLRGGIVISNETFQKYDKECFVKEDGRTFVRLLEGSVYIIKIGDEYFYPNGDYCPVGVYGRAIYMGDRKWINTSYYNIPGVKLIWYTVIWPPD